MCILVCLCTLFCQSCGLVFFFLSSCVVVVCLFVSCLFSCLFVCVQMRGVKSCCVSLSKSAIKKQKKRLFSRWPSIYTQTYQQGKGGKGRASEE